jgi:anti-sigma factor RsiW
MKTDTMKAPPMKTRSRKRHAMKAPAKPGVARTIRQCRDVIELLTEYIDGTLRAGDTRRLETHLGDCGPCAVFLDSLRKTRDAAGALRARKVPEACARALRALLKKRLERPRA